MMVSQRRRVVVPGSPIEIARAVPERTRLALMAIAAGRCEFSGCNKFILEHPVTHELGLFTQVAHIVAFKEDGPRGKEGERPANSHVLSNLMLLCADCHKLVDDNPGQYPRALLEEHKAAHEDRIHIQTEVGPNRQTAVLVFKAPIGTSTVAISDHEIAEAAAPRYANFRRKVDIDLTNLLPPKESPSFLAVAKEQIDLNIDRMFGAGSEVMEVGHLSVFALAPIPLLVHLGSRLTNKVPTDLFQRHRTPENWAWRGGSESVRYVAQRRQEGPKGGSVTLLLSLSGAIAIADLPEETRHDCSIYEVTLDGLVPTPTFLRQRSDLEAFRRAFQEVIGMILADHGLIPWINLIPAVPAPIAVLCGRERLPKAHPGFRVYDRIQGKYVFQMEVS